MSHETPHHADVKALLAELEALKRRTFQLVEGATVGVPPQLETVFQRAQEVVNDYFRGIEADPAKGAIHLGSERYLLVRGASLSVDFFSSIKELYKDLGEDRASLIGREFLFDMAHLLGVHDARLFHREMKVEEAIEKLSAGPVHFAFSGWARVELMEDSNPEPGGEGFLLHYRHPNSFEAEAWLRSGEAVRQPVCIMNAGYSSGWCEESFGRPLTAVEFKCRACGDEHCEFLMAPPQHIEAHLRRHAPAQANPHRSGDVHIPLFFERKATEERLHLQDVAMRTSANAIVITDRQGVITWANPAFTELAGFAEEEVLGKTLSIQNAGVHSRAFFEDLWVTILRGDTWHGEITNRRKDGSLYLEEQTITPVRARGGEITHFIAVKQDVTEREATGAAVRKSEALLSSILEHSTPVIYLKDLEGRYLFVNQQFESLFNVTNEDVQGKTDDDLFPVEHARVFQANDRRVLAADTSLEMEEVAPHEDGPHTYISLKFPVRDATGELLGVGGISTDITDRLRADEEKRRLEEQVQHAEKLKSLGVLAGGIAHDFNNILMGILGNVDLALMKSRENPDLVKYLTRIETSARRAASLTHQMLAYSGNAKFTLENVNLSSLIQESLPLLRTVISKKAELVLNLRQNLPAVLGGPAQLLQVVMNLFTNASEALEEQTGTITCRTGVVTMDEPLLSRTLLQEVERDRPYVFLEMTDTGTGITPAQMDKIFDPFFSTKFTGRGLGLATVLGITRAHGGTLSVDSSTGGGTTFTVYLPATGGGGRGMSLDEYEDGEELHQGRGTVLVVDDEPAVREVVSGLLQEAGYNTITATDGREGVEAFRQSGGVDLVLLDMLMPNLGGAEALKEIRRLDPSVPVLLTSGYDQEHAARPLMDGGRAGFIQKPYKSQTLLRTVREWIERKGA